MHIVRGPAHPRAFLAAPTTSGGSVSPRSLHTATAWIIVLFLSVPAIASANHELVTFRAEGRAWGRVLAHQFTSVDDASGDLNGDGAVDLISPVGTALQILINRGDGTYLDPVLLGQSDGIDAGTPAVGDLNCDGKLDIVAGERSSNQFSIFYGNGDGTFQPRVHVPAGGTAVAAAVADLDCDGQPDVICSVSQGVAGNFVKIFRNGGCGSMLPPVSYDVTVLPHVIQIADLNRDGHADIVMGTGASVAGISVYLGNGDGTLHLPRIDTNVSCFGGDIALGDWNLDGILDVAWLPLPNPSALATRIGLGDGTFVLETQYIGDFGSTLAAGDMNEDGITDIVVPALDRMRVFRGLGNGAFVAPAMPPGNGGLGNESCMLLDLDRDGHLDVVEDGMRVHHGNGDGTFGDAPTYPLASNPSALQSIQLNADLLPDLVAVTEDGFLATYSNAGAGILAGLVTQPTGGSALDVGVADMNGDGRQDAVVCGEAGSQGFVSVHLRNPFGGLAAPVTTLIDSVARNLTLGDLNADGIPDIITTADASIAARLGNGAGGFAPPTTLPANWSPRATAITDLNEDGKKDIVVVNVSPIPGFPVALSVFLGIGNGTFGPRSDLAAVSSTSIVAEDFDEDGHVDLVTDGARFYPGKGDGTLYSPIIPPITTVPPLFRSIHAADANQDGWLDLIGQVGAGRVYVLVSEGDGNFFQGGQFLSYYANPHSLAVADWNADGRPDFAMAHPTEGRVMMNFNRGPGVHSPAHGIFAGATSYASGPGAVDLAIADFNRDGKLDAATTTPSDSVSILLGNGSGLGSPSYWKAALPRALAAGDVNKDAMPDLVTCSFSPNPRISVLLGNGSGGFAAPAYITIPNNVFDIEVGDVNVDGNPDVVITGFQPVGVQVLLGNGFGGFDPPQPQPFNSGTGYEVKIARINQDCLPDLVVVTGEGGTVEVLFGSVGGGFVAGGSYSLGDESYTVVVGDFNRDGNTDVAAPRMFGGMAFLPGSASGSLGPISSFTSGDLLDCRASAGDLDGDSFLDVVVGSGGQDRISILRGNGDGTFDAPENLATARPFANGVADWNRDGNLDIAAAGGPFAAGTVSIFLNGTGPVTGVESQAAAPRARLSQNAPNPFNPLTTIRMSFAVAGAARLVVFDVRGRKVATLLDRVVPAGEMHVRWDGRDDSGRAVASGVYFYRLSTASGLVEARKMVLTK